MAAFHQGPAFAERKEGFTDAVLSHTTALPLLVPCQLDLDLLKPLQEALQESDASHALGLCCCVACWQTS
ncbi:hypothetical protein HaLaN_13337 [Haematococcus lacustris]|uniref:Uncharacterized protein n=1 Tax=Haematococcus lacustris TaxID=44745 RepID=A0A699Z2N7_HAELA|nr:hypothetical protein HaLaN_13337 [Haematococcus lacustris]